MKLLIAALMFLPVVSLAETEVAREIIPNDSKHIQIYSFNEAKVVVGTRTVVNPDYPCQQSDLNATCSQPQREVAVYGKGYKLVIEMYSDSQGNNCNVDNCEGDKLYFREIEFQKSTFPELPKLSGWSSNTKLAKSLFRLDVVDKKNSVWLLVLKK